MNRVATTVLLAALLAVAGLRPAPAQSISGVEPAGPYPGHPVTITGSGFDNNTSDVSYNGTSVDFAVESDSEIRARVPEGATTDASFEVTTDGGTATSSTVSLDTEPGLYGPRRTLAFDGSGDYVATGAGGDDLGLANESFSVGVWFRAESLQDDRTLVGMDEPETTNETLHLVLKGDGAVRFGFFGNDLDSPSGTVSTGTWTHLTFVYDASSGDRYIYKNGEQVASDNTSSDFQGTSEVLIGRWGGDRNYFDGEIDQVRVWQGALSAAEVRERTYRTVQPGDAAFGELEAAWRLDAGGTTTAFETTDSYRFGTFQGDPQRAAASGARLGQESASTTGADASVGTSGGELSATNVSTSSGESIQLYRFGAASAPRRSDSDPGEIIDGETTDKRSNLTWGLATNGDPSADLEIDYASVQGVSSPVRLIRRDGPGEPWANADDWSHDSGNQTFTISGTAEEGQYAVKTGPIATNPPTATTDPFSSIGAASAGLAGTVNPEGLETDVEFQYRETGASSFQSVTASESPLAAGREDQSVSATISGLTPDTEYEVKVVATNSEGTTEGSLRTFVAGRVYVDESATGAGDGSSWTNAHTDLQAGIDEADSDVEVWVAEGVYKPGSEEGDSFTITGQKDGLEVYGGFDATESTRSDRAPKENRTILSGDLNGDDDDPDGDGIIEDASDLTGGDNAHHVLILNGGDGLSSNVGDNVTSSTVLDGLVVTAGQADGSSFPDDSGGGLFCDGWGSGNECSPTLANALFAGNEAGDGGAIYNDGFSSGISSPSITNATFTGNEAGDGGAIFNSGYRGTSSPSITNATFTGNTASGDFADGGAIFNLGRNSGGTSSPSITNATFTGNTASNDGGAIFNSTPGGGTSRPQVANTILWGNSASNFGDEIFNNSGGGDASAALTHTIIEGGVNGDGVGGDDNDDDGDNLDQDPLFVDVATPAGLDGTFATDDDSLNVGDNSPALDAGTNDTVSVSTDITGAARIQDRDGDGTATVNIGAYEAEEPARTIFVDADASGDADGLSWQDAFTDPQTALDAATSNDELWVAEGVYTPGSEGESFTIPGQKDGLEVYGGFESGDAFSDRDPDAHPTVLSGDVGGDDNTDADGVTPTAGDISGPNADHVLVLNAGTGLGTNVGLNITTRTVIDGVIVTAGQADGSFPNNQGGGLYCDGANSGNECSPTLRDVVFAGNASGESGAAVYADGGGGGTVNLAAQRSVFASNAAGGSGGGIAAEGEAAAVSVTSSLFVDNDGATGGGAINVRIGSSGPVQPQIVNSTFVDNTASGGGSNTRGGALSFFANTGTLEPTVANAILWGNTAPSGNQIGSNAGSGDLTLTVGHSLVEGGESGIAEANGAQTTYASSNLDQDPEFRDRGAPAGPDGTLATADDGLNVTPGSPAPDAGDNGEIPSGVTDDITGADRTQDQNGSGTATVNLGAYEQIPPSPPVASGTAVQNVTGTSAEVTGTANAGGLETAVQVRYFPTADPSDVTTATAPSSPIVDGNFADQDVTVSLDGLSPDTEYKARLVASNNEGLVDGGTVSFTTDAGYARTISGTDGTGNDAGWRMLALPAAGKTRAALEDNLEFSVNSGSILYRWTSGSWTAQTSSSNDLPRGRGFMLYFFDDVIDPIDAEGLPLAVGTGPEDQSTDKTVGGLGQSETYHLLGNPFDVAFDLSELNLSGQGFQQTVQIWDPSSQSYTQVTQSGDQSDVVGAWQGFFVERDPNASTDGESLTFSTAGKQSGPGTIIGGQAAALADTKRSDEKRLRLGLRLAVLDTTESDTAPPSPKADAAAPSRPVPDSLTTEAAAQSSNQSSDGAQADTVGTGRLGLLLSSEATGGWDAYEASQLGPPGGGTAAVTLSSPLERGSDESIQRALASEPYPGENAAVTVPVSMQARAGSGQATIRLSESQREAIPSGWALRLTDTRAGEQADLLTEAYRFTLDETGGAGGTAPPESRFRLAVGPRGALPTPDGLALEAPYPNPTTQSVTVEYAVPRDKADGAQLQLYDVLGRRVRTVSVKPGPRTQRLDVRGLASGVYILRLTAEGAQQTRKLTVVR